MAAVAAVAAGLVGGGGSGGGGVGLGGSGKGGGKGGCGCGGRQRNSDGGGTTSQKCRPTHFRVCRSLKVYSLK
jgi:hypothetical protein